MTTSIMPYERAERVRVDAVARRIDRCREFIVRRIHENAFDRTRAMRIRLTFARRYGGMYGATGISERDSDIIAAAVDAVRIELRDAGWRDVEVEFCGKWLGIFGEPHAIVRFQ